MNDEYYPLPDDDLEYWETYQKPLLEQQDNEE